MTPEMKCIMPVASCVTTLPRTSITLAVLPKTRFIYISESLTKMNKKLFKSALRCKKDLKYQFIWSVYGKIYFARTRAAILVLEHLRQQAGQVQHDDRPQNS